MIAVEAVCPPADDDVSGKPTVESLKQLGEAVEFRIVNFVSYVAKTIKAVNIFLDMTIHIIFSMSYGDTELYPGTIGLLRFLNRSPGSSHRDSVLQQFCDFREETPARIRQGHFPTRAHEAGSLFHLLQP
jgi:hypothetical protein